MIGVYSPLIEEISAWLRRCGVRVYLHATPPDPRAAGLYRSETREIWIAPDLSARQALLTLAHEAGHWLGYLIHERVEDVKCEQQAYVYGWHVLRWFDAPVSRAEWLDACREAERLRRREEIRRLDSGVPDGTIQLSATVRVPETA